MFNGPRDSSKDIRFNNQDNNLRRKFSNKNALSLKENPKKGKKKNRIETRMSKVHPTIKLLRGSFAVFNEGYKHALRIEGESTSFSSEPSEAERSGQRNNL
jgi:hypothetical protein